jgi:DNA processing protein
MEEIINMLPSDSPFGLMTHSGYAAPETNTVLDSMGFDAIDFDTILTATGLTSEVLSSMLSIPENEGKISSTFGGKYQRLMSSKGLGTR